LLELRDWLVAEQVTLVVLEATGDYWRGAFYLLEDDLNVILVNAAHAKGLPGRKTDVCDASWLCQMGEVRAAAGLVRAAGADPAAAGSDPLPHHADRRTHPGGAAVGEGARGRRDQTVFGGHRHPRVSGRAMLAALIAGEDDAVALAELAKGRMRPKIPQLVQALTGNFGAHHAFLCRLHLERIDQLSATIEELSTRIEEQMRPSPTSLTGWRRSPASPEAVAEVIVAETGGDMSRFPVPDTSPRGPGGVPATTNRRANVNQAGPVTVIGGCAAPWAPPPWPRPEPRTPPTSVPDTDDSSHAWARRKPSSPVEHSILTAAWHMLTDDVDYHDLGGDYFARLDPNAPCAASSDKPTPSATPSGSTPSKPPDPAKPPDRPADRIRPHQPRQTNPARSPNRRALSPARSPTTGTGHRRSFSDQVVVELLRGFADPVGPVVEDHDPFGVVAARVARGRR